jgi:hypothetical protein
MIVDKDDNDTGPPLTGCLTVSSNRSPKLASTKASTKSTYKVEDWWRIQYLGKVIVFHISFCHRTYVLKQTEYTCITIFV